jgi:uncharacterized protein (DUF2147 family)
MSGKIIRLVMISLIFSMNTAWAADADSILGFWRTPDEDALFEIYRCGPLYCGNIAGLQEPDYPATDKQMPGMPKVDRVNPDPALRKRTLVGLPLILGFHYEGDNSWKGAIYNPENGKTYKCMFSMDGENRLKVRGYIVIPLLGGTQTWTRSKQGAIAGKPD